MGARTDAGPVGPVDLPQPARSLHPMLRLFHYRGDFLLYDAKSNFGCVFASDDLGALISFLEGQSFDAAKASRGDANDDHFVALWHQLERLRGLGGLTPGPLTQIAEVDTDSLAAHIRYYDANIATRKFCLEVTQDCNFRCLYCPFTVETKGRVHAKVHMTREIATKAIDYYFDRYTRLYSRVPESKRETLLERAAPTLAWYGGEPLLRFGLVRDSLAHFAQKPWDQNQRRRINYSLTTNFSIFSDEIAEFLTSHRVLLYVSLDGPESENDKNRTFVGGGGTFKRVFGNLQKLKARDPEYFTNCVVIQSVAADNVNVSACASFFKGVGDSLSGRLGLGRYRPGVVSKRGSVVCGAELERAKLQATFSSSVASFAEQLSSVRDLTELEAARSANAWFNGQLAQLKGFFGMAESPRPCSQVRRGMITCPMGFDHLYVSADGGFHMCHLTDGTVGIGDVNRGVDHSLIMQRYLQYNSSWNNAQCRSCWIIDLCELCAAVLSKEEQFFRPTPTECECLRLSAEQAMCNYLSLCDRPALLKAVRSEIETSYKGRADIQRL